MVSTGYHSTGEEFITRLVYTEDVDKPPIVRVGLYNDSQDSLTDDDDLGAVTTEPSDGQYARLEYTFGEDFNASVGVGNSWEGRFIQKSFDLIDTTGMVDAYFATVEFQTRQEASASEHLLFSALIEDGSMNDLSANDVGNFDGGVALD